MSIKKHSAFNMLTFFLIFTSVSSGFFPGAVTKLALCFSIVLNVIFFPKFKNIMLMIFFTIYILSTILIDSNEVINGSHFIILIFILWFISSPKNNKGYFNSIGAAVISSFIIGVLLSSFSILYSTSTEPLFIYDMENKGLPGVYAFLGLSNIPQTFGTLGVISFVFSHNKNSILSYLFLIIGNLSLNRVTLIITLVSFLRKRLFFSCSISFILILVYISLLNPSELTDNPLFVMHSLINRMGLTLGIWEQYISGSFWDLLIGIKNKPEVFYITSLGGVDYIENGYMFLLFHYGVLGLYFYLLFFIFWIILVPLLSGFKINKLYFYISTIYFFIVPLLTHELLHMNFYIMMYVLFYKSYSYNN